MDKNLLALYPALATQDVTLTGAAGYYGSIKFRGDTSTAMWKLLVLIREGKMITTGNPRDGERRIIPVEYFLNAFPASAHSWSRDRIILNNGVIGDTIERNDQWIWKNICVDRDALLALVGVHAGEKSSKTTLSRKELCAAASTDNEKKVEREISFQSRGDDKSDVKTEGKQNKPEAIAARLEKMYEARPPMKNPELMRELSRQHPEIGEISPRTFSSALQRLGWSKTSQKSAKARNGI